MVRVAVSAPEEIVGPVLREHVRIGSDAGPNGAALAVVGKRAVRIDDLQLVGARAGDVPLVGVTPVVPVAEPGRATRRAAVTVSRKVERRSPTPPKISRSRMSRSTSLLCTSTGIDTLCLAGSDGAIVGAAGLLAGLRVAWVRGCLPVG